MSQQTPASPVKALQQSWSLVQRSLLKPFDANNWLVLGLCAWLMTLAEGSGSFGIQLAQPLLDIASQSGLEWSDLAEELSNRMGLAVIVVGTLALLGVTILWLRCHGAFMLLDNLAHDRALIRQPWRDFAKPALGLAGLRLALTTVGTLVTLAHVGAGAWLLWDDIQANRFDRNTVMVFAGVGVALTVTLLTWAAATLIINDLAFPIMYARGCGALRACRLAIRAVLVRPLATLLYILLKWVLVFVIATVTSVTCCFTCGLSALPLIGTILLLPIPVFLTGYAACFVEQLHDDYQIFQETLPSPQG